MYRVFPLVVLSVLQALLVCGQTPEHQIVSSSVGIFMDFESTPGTALLEVMKREVDELLKPSGVSLDWRLTKQNHGDELFAGLVVLKFKGKCQTEGLQARPRNNFGSLGEIRELGSTQVANGRVLPYSEVECDPLREALRYLSPAAGQAERQAALGRAMGRVVAHELYHILAKTTSHAARGLARASESLQDLISGSDDQFRDEDSKMILNGLKASEKK